MNTSYSELVSAGRKGNIGLQKPFWAIDYKDEKILAEWLSSTQQSTRELTQSILSKQLTNLCLERGYYWEDKDKYADFLNLRRTNAKPSTKLVVNDVRKYVQILSNKLNRFRPSVVVSPDSSEFSDKQSARVAKKVLDTQDMDLNLRELIVNNSRKCLRYGEGVMFVLWDKNKGGFSKRWQKAKEKYENKKMKIKSGKEDWVYDPKKPESIGDLELYCASPFEYEMEQRSRPQDVGWVKLYKVVSIDWLKREYPEKEKELGESSTHGQPQNYLDVDRIQIENSEDYVVQCETWVRSSKYLPEGRYIKSVGDVILESENNPYSDIEVLKEQSEWGDLPIERMVAWQVDGQLTGESILNAVIPLIHAKNKSITLINRILVLLGYPKILAPRTAKISYKDINNDISVIEWSGQAPPQAFNFAALPNGVFEFIQYLAGECDKQMAVHPISQGAPPAGIKAGVALRLLEELEDQQLTDLIQAQNIFVLALARRRLGLASKFYKKEDGRLVRILGVDQQDVLEVFDIKDLGKKFTLRLEEAGQMARSPAARAQQILDLVQYDPQAFTPDEIKVALDLVQPERITDPAYAAVNLAEFENEQCAQNKPIPEPREGEKFMVHWNIHMSYYQRRGFAELPEEAQAGFKEHVMLTEYLMYELAQKNQAFTQELMLLRGFPAFFTLPPIQLVQQQMQAQQQQMQGQPIAPQQDQMMAPEQALMPQEKMSPQQITKG